MTEQGENKAKETLPHRNGGGRGSGTGQSATLRRHAGPGPDPERRRPASHWGASAKASEIRSLARVLGRMLHSGHVDRKGDIGRGGTGRSGGNVLARSEQLVVGKALELSRYNQVQAARLLGVSRNVLRERMKRYNLL